MRFQTPRGTRDILPEEMIKRQYVIDTMRTVFEKWGFDPMETPAFEDWNLLSAKFGGGEEIKKEIYYFKDKSDRELGLRFEFTTSLARVIANNPNLPKPFKRYSIGNIWRYDRPGKGRYREFCQADADIIGSEKIDADIEILMLICDVFTALGFNDFIIKINNRKLIERYAQSIGIKNVSDIFRSVDKLNKTGEENVIRELQSKNINKSVIKKLIIFIRSDPKTTRIDGIDDLKTIVQRVKEYGYNNINIDFSLMRGLDYYTGLVFEVFIGGSLLSVAGGGRYDNLIEKLGGKKTPAVGLGFGIDRIADFIPGKKSTKTKIFAVIINKRPAALSIVKKIRSLGVSCETDIMQRGLKKQLDYVNAKGIPYVIFIGKNEIKENMIKLRNMKTGNEESIPLSMMAQKLKNL